MLLNKRHDHARVINIAPRWGAVLAPAVFYKHCTPLGCGGVRFLRRPRSINIAPRWGAVLTPATFYKHSTPLGCGSCASRVL